MSDQPAPREDLDDLRATLEQIDEVPMHERPRLFEHAHEVLVAELNALEEV